MLRVLRIVPISAKKKKLPVILLTFERIILAAVCGTGLGSGEGVIWKQGK